MPETPERAGLERLTINLNPRGVAALATGMALTGDTKTDTVTRALQLYAYFQQVWDGGGTVMVQRHPNSETETVRVL